MNKDAFDSILERARNLSRLRAARQTDAFQLLRYQHALKTRPGAIPEEVSGACAGAYIAFSRLSDEGNSVMAAEFAACDSTRRRLRDRRYKAAYERGISEFSALLAGRG